MPLALSNDDQIRLLSFSIYFRAISDLTGDHIEFLIKKLQKKLKNIFKGKVSVAFTSSICFSSYLMTFNSLSRHIAEGMRTTNKEAEVKVGTLVWFESNSNGAHLLLTLYPLM